MSEERNTKLLKLKKGLCSQIGSKMQWWNETNHSPGTEGTEKRGKQVSKTHACVGAACPTSKLWTMLDKHNQSFEIWFFCLISLAAYLQITMLPLSFCRCVQPAAHGCPTIAMNATTDLLMWMIMSIGGYKIKWLDTSKDKPNSWVSFWNCFLCWKGQGEVSHHCLQRQASFLPCPQVATIVTFPWQDSRSAYKVDLC